jgi:hypothetical protein
MRALFNYRITRISRTLPSFFFSTHYTMYRIDIELATLVIPSRWPSKSADGPRCNLYTPSVPIGVAVWLLQVSFIPHLLRSIIRTCFSFLFIRELERKDDCRAEIAELCSHDRDPHVMSRRLSAAAAATVRHHFYFYLAVSSSVQLLSTSFFF